MNEEKQNEAQAVESKVGEPEEGQRAKKGSPVLKGCLLGCLIVFLLGALLVVFGIYTTYNKVQSFTSDKPRTIETSVPSQSEITRSRTKLENLKSAINRGDAVETELSEIDINALVYDNENLRGKIAVQIDGDKLSAEGSIPLKDFPVFKDRHLNGRFSLKVSNRDGRLVVNAESIEVNGKPIPEEIMAGIRNENLLEKLYTDPNIGPVIKQVESASIENGKLILKLRKKP